MKVAFLGLGNMGHPMAQNLLQAGHQLTVWNRTREKGDNLRAAGARLADTPAEAARDAEVAFTMLADDAAVERVVFASDGLLHSSPRNAIHISSSTISVELSRRMKQAHAEHGQLYLAAPVFGRPDAAKASKLFVVVAGEGGLIEKCKPLFSAIGQQTFVLGREPEIANVVKLSGNFLIASVLESLGEALALVQKYGVDPQQYLEMLTSTLFNAPVYKTYGRLMVERKFEPAGFKVKLGLKDTRLVLAAGEGASAPLPIASLIRDHFLQAIAQGMGDKDWSSLGLVAANNAGLE